MKHEMKKVGIVITRMISGGASGVVEQIVRGGAGRYDFTLYTGPEGMDRGLVKRLDGLCRVVEIPSLCRDISPWNDWQAYRGLVCEFRKAGHDVVHTHTSKAGFLGRLAARRAGVGRIIHTPHGTIYSGDAMISGVPRLSFVRYILILAERYAGRRMDILTTLSEDEKRVCLELGLSSEGKTEVVYNGIDFERFSACRSRRADARKDLGFEDGDLVVTSVGRLSPEKGHSVLVDAAAKVAEGLDSAGGIYSCVKVVLVGEGPERERLEKQMADVPASLFELRRGMQVSGVRETNNQYPMSNVQYPMSKGVGAEVGDGGRGSVIGNRGAVVGGTTNDQQPRAFSVIFAGQSEDVCRYLAASDIFVMPSYYEGFGIALAEAMAAGLPVVASRVGGIPEIVSDNLDGLLCTPGSRDELAEKILSLVQNPELKDKLAVNAGSRAEFFSEKRMLEAYFRIYEGGGAVTRFQCSGFRCQETNHRQLALEQREHPARVFGLASSSVLVAAIVHRQHYLIGNQGSGGRGEFH
ncbi:MAG: glycosyltransferase family 4 protein [Victivallales bacterium]|nr:glycosyltransferase family 4 protein [Victivallales bacterium]